MFHSQKLQRADPEKRHTQDATPRLSHMLSSSPSPLTRREAALLVTLALVNTLALSSIVLSDPRDPSRLLLHVPFTVEVALTDLHRVYADHLSNARYIDLTHTIRPNMPVWAGFDQPTFGPSLAKGTDAPFSYGADGFIAQTVRLATDQLGTQLDPPAHWSEYGATISDLPPTVTLRPLVLIDLSAKTAVDPGYHATVDDVTEWEAIFGRIREGSAVLFRTDWSRGWDSYGATSGPATFPGVSLAVLKFLHLNRSILVHGHEPLDTDMTPTLEGEEWLMHNNFLQIEGVANLHMLPPSGCLISIGFPKLAGGTGGFCRLIAICPPEWPHGQTVAEQPAAPLPVQRAPLRRGADGVLVPTEGATPTRYCAGNSPHWREGCKKAEIVSPSSPSSPPQPTSPSSPRSKSTRLSSHPSPTPTPAPHQSDAPLPPEPSPPEPSPPPPPLPGPPSLSPF